MEIRGSTKRDYKGIDEILKQYPHLSFDIAHLESMVVAIENDKVIAFGSLHKLLEGTFLCDLSTSHGDRVKAFESIVLQSRIQAKLLGFDMFHSFSTNDIVTRTLVKHFGFAKGKGENLILGVE